MLSGTGVKDGVVSEAMSLRSVFDTVLAAASVGDPDSDLRTGTGRDRVLTQTHGIVGNNIEELARIGDSSALTRARKYDERFDGIAVGNYYGHESVDGRSKPDPCSTIHVPYSRTNWTL